MLRQALFVSTLLVGAAALDASAQEERPNILIIWGDDVGMWNISAYHRVELILPRRLNGIAMFRSICPSGPIPRVVLDSARR